MILVFGRAYSKHTVLYFLFMCSIILLYLCITSTRAGFLTLVNHFVNTKFVIQTNRISVSHFNQKTAPLITLKKNPKPCWTIENISVNSQKEKKYGIKSLLVCGFQSFSCIVTEHIALYCRLKFFSLQAHINCLIWCFRSFVMSLIEERFCWIQYTLQRSMLSSFHCIHNFLLEFLFIFLQFIFMLYVYKS